MHRHFGLGHLRSSRAAVVPPRYLPGFTARLLYSVECALKGAHHGFGQAHRLTGEKVAVRVQYMGRQLFVHEPELSTYAYSSSDHVEGDFR